MTDTQTATLFDDGSTLRGSTPLMRQYFSIKDQHPNAILLFRMGDFYETFDEDARTVSRVLGITLTKRANGKAAEVALAGFPHHALDTYLPRLVRSGFRVAVCEQLEDPKTARTVVKRGVTEIVTPGVSFRDELLDPVRPNYVAAFVEDSMENLAGAAFVDVSTGDFRVSQGSRSHVQGVLRSVGPTEILLRSPGEAERDEWHRGGCTVSAVDEWMFGREFAYETLVSHFRTQSLKGFGIEGLDLAVAAAGAVLAYISEAQKGHLPHIRRIVRHRDGEHMLLDTQTRRNLDIADVAGGPTLISIMDRTSTPMGARQFRAWLLQPLTNAGAINARLDAVDALFSDRDLLESMRAMLSGIGDVERLTARNATGRSRPRDLIALAESVERIPEIRKVLNHVPQPLARLVRLDADVAPVSAAIRKSLADEPASVGSSDVTMRPGFSKELDELRRLARDGKSVIAGIQHRETKRTGISSLKVGYNKVFGYYLEVTNAHREKVPDDYIRKQTLVNAERYVTPELKETEERILHAQERMATLEAELFDSLCEEVAVYSESLFEAASEIAVLDVLCCFASFSREGKYIRPTVDDGLVLDVTDGRHPVVEASLPVGEPFIPNSVRVDPEAEQILVITGPNMAGKSVILRQTGIICLLAQSGCFVPAASAHVGVVDRIFTRVGASDNLAEGESTFLVEMNETANILNNATRRSLILLDEVGRGTSTFDGLSIAWSIVEYLHDNDRVAAKTLFATHYHELNELAERLARVKNYRVLVQEHGGRVIFLRRLVAGGADHSYGIEVARMAGLPVEVIDRAREVLDFLERTPLATAVTAGRGDGASLDDLPEPSVGGPDPAGPAAAEIARRIEALDLNRLTPIEALVKLNELRDLIA